MAYEPQARILHLLENKDLPENCAEGLTLLAKLIRPVFIPITVERGAHEVDRTSSFFFGFPWTSEEFPWPDRCKDAISGWLDAPLLQLNLDQVTKSTGEDIGSGLLQVFLPGSYEDYSCFGRDGFGIDAPVRRIPAKIIKQKDALTPFLLEGASPLEICQAWESIDFPCTYDDFIDPESGQEYMVNGWTLDKIQKELENGGLFSNRYELRALEILDWKPFVPRGHADLSKMSDKEICAALKDWQPGLDSFGDVHSENHPIIEGLLGATHSKDDFPIPGLFSWPVSFNGQNSVVDSGQMPLIVFHGLQEQFWGDSIDVFMDGAIWRHGYYI